MNIFKAIARQLGFFMTSSEKQRKDKFFKEMQTHSEEMQDELEPIPCPMHEDYDDVDHLDEVKDVEKDK